MARDSAFALSVNQVAIAGAISVFCLAGIAGQMNHDFDRRALGQVLRPVDNTGFRLPRQIALAERKRVEAVE
jgi:hypothetical protein